MSMTAGERENRTARRRSICNRELLFAAEDEGIEEVEHQLSQGADVNFRDADGNTCLHWAATGGHTHVIEHLLRKDELQKVVVNNRNETALDVAWKNKTGGNGGSAWKTIGECIVKEAKYAVSEHEKLFPESRNTQEERIKTFYEATFLGDYNHPYSENDVRSLLNFFCPPLPASEARDVMISLNFSLGCQRSVTLILEEKEIYFQLFWDSKKKNIGGQLLTESYGFSGHDVTIPLLKVKIACDWLIGIKDGKNKKQSLKTEIASKLKRAEEKSNEYGRKLFANMLNEMARSNSKMQTCTEFLKTVLQETGNDVPFSFTASNIFIYFLETFALEDTYFEIHLSPEEETLCARKKKQFYQRFYPTIGKDKESAIKDIQKLRQKLVHNNSTSVLTPDTIKTFITHKIGETVPHFFRCLLSFAEHVVSSLSGSTPKTNKLMNDFLEKLHISSGHFCDTKHVVNHVQGGSLETLLHSFCENIAQIYTSPDVVQELLFDLVANLSPKLDKYRGSTMPKLLLLRHEILHNFQNESKRELCRKLPSAVQDWYRLQLSLGMHDVLYNMREDSECRTISAKLNDVLRAVNERFLNFKLPTYELESGSVTIRAFDDSMMEAFEEHVVDIYINYLAPVFDGVSATDEDDNILMSHTEVDHIQKKEIFEQVKYLDRIREKASTKEYVQGQEMLKKTLKEKLHLSESEATHATNVVKDGISLKNLQLQKEVVSLMKSIYALIYDLKRCALSRQDLVLCFERFVHNSSSEGFLEQTSLSQEEREAIKERLQSLPTKTQTREVQYGEGRVQVGICSTVINLLKIVTEVQKVNQLKFETVECAFKDNTFLSYLVKHSVRSGENGNIEFKDPFHTYKVLRDIQGISYTSPYASKLLTCTKDLRVLNDVDLQNLLKNLLTGQAENHLEAMLHLKSDRVLSEMSKLLLIGAYDEQNMCGIFRALCSSDTVEDCLATIKTMTSMNSEKNIRAFVKGGHSILLQFIREHKLENAECISGHLNKLLDNFSDSLKAKKEVQFELLKREQNLLEAKLLNEQGCQKCENGCQQPKLKGQCKIIKICEGSKYFAKALAVLENVSEWCKMGTDDARVSYFLGLSRKAYSYILIGRCTKGKGYAEKAVEVQKKLGEELWKFIARDQTSPPDYEEFYRRAEESSKYRMMLSGSEECFKYLNATKVFNTYLWYEFTRAVQDKDVQACYTLLTQWDKVYLVWNTTAGNAFKERAIVGIFEQKAKIHGFISQHCDPTEGHYHTLKALELSLLVHSSARRLFGPYSKWVFTCNKTLRKKLWAASGS